MSSMLFVELHEVRVGVRVGVGVGVGVRVGVRVRVGVGVRVRGEAGRLNCATTSPPNK